LEISFLKNGQEAFNVIIWKHRGEESYGSEAGSGEKMRKVGAKGAPAKGAFQAAALTAKKP
jgi:hypothetical protein